MIEVRLMIYVREMISERVKIAHWITDHYHLSLNLTMGISEGCFIFDFASLPLEVTQPIYPSMCTKVAIKHQSSFQRVKIMGNKSFLLTNKYITIIIQ